MNLDDKSGLSELFGNLKLRILKFGFWIDNPEASGIQRCGLVGTWLSLVEHSVRDAGVARSNRAVPTK